MDEEGGRKWIDTLLIAGVALFGLGSMVAGGWVLRMGVAHASAPETIERRLLADPGIAPVMEAMKQHYPKDFAETRDHISTMMREGMAAPQLRSEIAQRMRQISLDHLEELAQAPHAELAAYNAAERRLLESLQEGNTYACANYVSTGSISGHMVSPESQRLIGEMAAIQIRAAAAGRDHPAGRETGGDVSDADANALVAAMRQQGMTQDDFEAWGMPQRFATIGPVRQCAIGMYLARGLDTLPAAQADRLTAYLLLLRN